MLKANKTKNNYHNNNGHFIILLLSNSKNINSEININSHRKKKNVLTISGED